MLKQSPFGGEHTLQWRIFRHFGKGVLENSFAFGMHDLLRWGGSTCLRIKTCSCVLGALPSSGGVGGLGTCQGVGEGEGEPGFKMLCPDPRSTCRWSRSQCGVGAAWLAGRVCNAPAAAPSRSGGCFSLEERLFTIKFYLQVKGMMHPILNHCFSPEGLYYLERVCALGRAYTPHF